MRSVFMRFDESSLNHGEFEPWDTDFENLKFRTNTDWPYPHELFSSTKGEHITQRSVVSTDLVSIVQPAHFTFRLTNNDVVEVLS